MEFIIGTLKTVLEEVNTKKEAAVAEQDFDKAVWLRDLGRAIRLCIEAAEAGPNRENKDGK